MMQIEPTIVNMQAEFTARVTEINSQIQSLMALEG